MQIEKLSLKDYRSYKNKTIEFSEKVNMLVGKNAQGKTNVLEAIFFMILGKSFKTSKEKEVIKLGESYSQIKGEFKKRYRDVEIEVFFDVNHKKSIKIDGVAIKKIGELMSVINGVFFSPDELKLVKESPEDRRRFMNIVLSQTNKKYFYLLGRYEKVLANRNKLLKTAKDISSLRETVDIWDRALSDLAGNIYNERKKFVEEIKPFAFLAHDYLSGGKEKLDLKYVSSFEGENYAEKMSKALAKNLEKDYKLGFTSVGVHRDEIDFYLDGIEVKNFGSQGQQRTVALALKLAELEFIKNKMGEYPILLLDDVFSELDLERKERLLKFASKTQTIITCTEEPNIKNKLLMKDVKIIKIEKGD